MVKIVCFFPIKGSAEPRRAPNPGSAEGFGARFGRIFGRILGYGRGLKLQLIFTTKSDTGIDVNAIDENGLTPLHNAAKLTNPIYYARQKGCLKFILDNAIKFGIDVNAKTSKPQYLRNYAIENATAFELFCITATTLSSMILICGKIRTIILT